MITGEFYNLSKSTMKVLIAIMDGKAKGFPGASIGKLLALRLIHRYGLSYIVPRQVKLQYEFWVSEQAQKVKEKAE